MLVSLGMLNIDSVLNMSLINSNDPYETYGLPQLFLEDIFSLCLFSLFLFFEKEFLCFNLNTNAE